MMRLPMILAIARTEMRSTRRLARYWVFAVLSVLASFLIYMQYAAMHGFASRFSATIGYTGPRYLMAAVGLYLVIIFVLGLIFLAFDVRSRDIRERMVEVLDSRPVSNAEFLIGRTLGLVLMAWIPVLFVGLAVQTFGMTALSLDLPIGEPVEPYSLANFIIYALCAFTMWCSAVVLLAVLISNRLLVAVAALVLFGLQIWSVAQLPVYLQVILSVVPVASASDMTPSFITSVEFLQRLGMLILAAGFLVLAVAFHPRRDDGSKAGKLLLGSGVVASGIALLGVLAFLAVADQNQRSTWLADHQARRDEARADLLAIDGSVVIEPGTRLDLDLQIRVQAPPNEQLDTLLFTLNPGLTVQTITISGREAPWTQSSGLLEITPSAPLAPGAQMLIRLVASGSLNTDFGYLDSGLDLMTSRIVDSQLKILGIDISTFDSRYVALMPGSGWLPHTGSDLANTEMPSADYFEVNLEVDVPVDWLVAGPGRREVVDTASDRARFRFNPGAPLPEVGLMASRFERRAMEIAGIEFELLVHPEHRRNLELFAEAGDAIRTRVEELFTDANAMGFSYPYGGFSLVEIPANLRGYGGGWRMDTVQPLPGMMLLRETSFPTSRFEMEFRDLEALEDRDGGIAAAKLYAIERFFENDFSGGNLFLGITRNFLRFQTSATGEGAIAVNFLLDELVNLLLTGKRGFFSAYEFDQQLGFLVGQSITDMATGRTDSIVEAVTRAAMDRPSVWDRALGTSLTELDPADNPKQVLNVLSLKSQAIANSILDGLGREKTAALLTEILARYRGGHFSAADFDQVARDLDANLEPLIGDWLNTASLPGFLTSRVVVDRLIDADGGLPRYQTRVHVRNDEATPGLVRLRYATMTRSGSGGTGNTDKRWDTTEPLRIQGYQSVEVGILTSAPPSELWLQPYLALNRQDVRLVLPRIDNEAKVNAEVLIGPQPSLWRPDTSGFNMDIVVDDLDEGFSIAYDGPRADAPAGEPSFFLPKLDMDHGLPEFQGFLGPPTVWSRSSDSPSSWGKYRHTLTLIQGGTGDGRAVFTAHIPRAGRWQLAYHIPEATQTTAAGEEAGILVSVSVGPGVQSPLPMNLGKYTLTLLAQGQTYPLEFDGSVAEPGWNDLGQFQLAEGEAQVVVSDETSGNVVIADAVRWRPLFDGPLFDGEESLPEQLTQTTNK